MKRRRLTKAEHDEAFSNQHGLCSCGCRLPLVAGDYDEEHTTPLWLGGANGLENVTLMRKDHHAPKTARETKARAKSKRIKLKAKGGFNHTREFVKGVDGRVKRNPNAKGSIPW
jgi:hypothetical protein